MHEITCKHGTSAALAVKLAHMKIVLNGVEHDCDAQLSVAQLLVQHGYATRKVAVEINREILPKSRHAQHMLQAGDRVEIVHAIGGG
jgi:sulfur carrier protein